jgi:hypothetical protein
VEVGVRAYGATNVQIRRAKRKISISLGGVGFTPVGAAYKMCDSAGYQGRQGEAGMAADRLRTPPGFC